MESNNNCITITNDNDHEVKICSSTPVMYTKISELYGAVAGTKCCIGARLFRSRKQSKIIFLVLRQQNHTVQCVHFRTKTNTELGNLIESIPPESVITVTGIIKETKDPVKSCSIQNCEIEIRSVEIVSLSLPELPIQIDEHIYLPACQDNNNNQNERESKLVTRLNNRVLDLRRNDNIFIFKLQSEIEYIIIKFLRKNRFMGIHTPKLIGAASEGGSNVFKVKYFNQDAFLAQSPQLYKQMAICADFPRVYEIGPIFRAEKSFTHRHLTEFIGIDLEMVIEKDYHEILDLFSNMFTVLFHELATVHGPGIQRFFDEFGITPFEYVPGIRIKFYEAVGLLRNAGFTMGDFDDFTTETEKALGKIIKDKYHTDFFMVDNFPTCVRPFYTMPSAENPLYSNSYDFFIRGEEILSGAQRINDYEQLLKSALSHGIDVMKIADYLNSFKYGAYAHGGGGVGLERLVMFYLGINNIRNVSMFPRDPTRITP